ncbi:MAG: response regulator, partial [Planctomycetota bacterium]
MPPDAAAQPRVLLVDDEPRLLEGCQRHLRRHFHVTLAPGPREGLEAIEKGDPFAVVVSDMNMPVMNGVQFLAEVRTRQPNAVRIILTGNANLQAAMQAVNEGAIFRFL